MNIIKPNQDNIKTIKILKLINESGKEIPQYRVTD